MSKQNCWEFKRCGREPGGHRAELLGICPASVDESMDGLNGGLNAGRICWSVSGHFSEDGKVVCAPGWDLATCTACDFFKRVLQEETIFQIVFLKPSRPFHDEEESASAPLVERDDHELPGVPTPP